MIQCDFKPRVNDIVGVKNYHKKPNSIKYSQFRNNFTTETLHPSDDFSMMFGA